MLQKLRDYFSTKTNGARADRSLIGRPHIEALDLRRMMAVDDGAIGINVNDGSTAFMLKSTPVMKQLGVTTVRLWHDADFTKTPVWGGVLQRALDYKRRGFDVMLVIQTKDGADTDPADVKAWFEWALSNPQLKASVDRWEIGNEPDHARYWDGTLKSYVSDFLKPAARALHAAGEKVVSAAPSWNPDDVAEMISYGILSYTDYVGYHPYGRGVSVVKRRVALVNEIVAGRRPIIASEWNVRGFEDDAPENWAQAVQDAYPSINRIFAYNYYYALRTVPTLAGPAGILNRDGTRNTPFYNAFSSFQRIAATLPTTDETAPATITGTLWNDGDGDGIWSRWQAVTGARTVYIDTNANGRIDAGERATMSNDDGVYTFTGLAAGTYNITRVFSDGFKLSNSPTNYITITVSAGEERTGANLGTTAA